MGYPLGVVAIARDPGKLRRGVRSACCKSVAVTHTLPLEASLLPFIHGPALATEIRRFQSQFERHGAGEKLRSSLAQLESIESEVRSSAP